MRKATLSLAALVLTLTFASTLLAQPQVADSASRQEMQSLQQFLTNHPWIAGKLRENPSLANDSGFLRRSPELADFLNAHPRIQSDFKVDAPGVMSRAQHDNFISSKFANYQETYNFKQFLSAHPWIAGKLQSKPALANDDGFVKGNHELGEFLNAHPYVQSQFRADPNGFMRRVQDLPANAISPSTFDLHSSDYASLRAFLQNHPWIADKLKEDPSRANDRGFVNDTKELRQFLEAHPYLQEQFRQDARQTMALATQTGGEYF